VACDFIAPLPFGRGVNSVASVLILAMSRFSRCRSRGCASCS
jgi:hypothetical protein